MNSRLWKLKIKTYFQKRESIENIGMINLAKFASVQAPKTFLRSVERKFIPRGSETGYSKLYYKQAFGFSKYRKPSSSWEKPFVFRQQRKVELIFSAGLWLMVFGLCYSMVPLYKLVCQHLGFDVDYEKKDYSIKGKKPLLHRKFTLVFKADTDPDIEWDFDPIQSEVIVGAGETALVFYRAYNKQDIPVIGFATYEIFPDNAILYFSKIQCFCFNQQMLNPKEELQMPLYFYLEPEINDDPAMEKIDRVTIVYKFIRSKKQDLAKLAKEELEKVRKNKTILREMRIKKKLAEGMTEKQILEELGSSEDEDEEIKQLTQTINSLNAMKSEENE